jgi:hypothetical protein
MPHTPEQQLVRFFHFLDARRYDRLLDLMTPDAYWLRQGQPLRGREQALQTLHGRHAGMRVRHAVTNVVCDDDERDPVWQAHAEALAIGAAHDSVFTSHYLTAYRFDDPADQAPPWRIPGPHKFSVVHTRFVRAQEGWRIAAQLMLPEFVFDAHA